MMAKCRTRVNGSGRLSRTPAQDRTTAEFTKICWKIRRAVAFRSGTALSRLGASLLGSLGAAGGPEGFDAGESHLGILVLAAAADADRSDDVPGDDQQQASANGRLLGVATDGERQREEKVRLALRRPGPWPAAELPRCGLY